MVQLREDNGDIRLRSWNTGADTIWATASYAWAEGKTYNIRVVVDGLTVNVYVDATLELSYTFASTPDFYGSNAYGLARSTGSDLTQFDNFIIYSMF